MGICENVQTLCKQRSLPISHLEKELSLANGSIRRWNESSPSFDKLQKVAEYFKVSTDQLVFGFDRSLLASTLNLVRNGRSFSQFANDTGINQDELFEICSGVGIKPPSLETIEKIATDNPINNFIDRILILKAAGYAPDEIPEPAIDNDVFEGRYSGILYDEKPRIVKEPSTEYDLSPKEERDIARDLEKMLSDLESNNAIAFSGEPEDDEDFELLRASLLTSMIAAKKLAKKKFTPKKYRKEE